MKCMNCNGTNDVAVFSRGDEQMTLCAECRYKLATGGLTEVNKVGRPSLGVTKKVSLTLSEEEWEWFDERAKGNRSQFLRDLVQQSPESDWSNNACLGYAILGAKQLGYDKEQINQLVKAIYSEFDFKSVEKAKDVYSKSPY
ncbi:hypothetical protein [Paenisporosarcina quisquiliarum]|uniref:hypothetical protein n=1 Tax=Paenisporosarcina quisquiliarum TaxID=365346 RepID=UPI0037355C95